MAPWQLEFWFYLKHMLINGQSKNDKRHYEHQKDNGEMDLLLP